MQVYNCQGVVWLPETEFRTLRLRSLLRSERPHIDKTYNGYLTI